MKKTISFMLNGQRVSLGVAPNEVLLEALRDRLGVKSPKCGCDRGDCGACTVMIGGKTCRSCLVLAVEVDGQSVITLEGLMADGGMTPLQKALLEHNSFQCGFCAPGMILSAAELIEKNPRPSEEQIKEAIAGNLCRCTGYQPIVEAIKGLSLGPTPAGRGVGDPSLHPSPAGRGKGNPSTSAATNLAKLSASLDPSPKRRGKSAPSLYPSPAGRGKAGTRSK